MSGVPGRANSGGNAVDLAVAPVADHEVEPGVVHRDAVRHALDRRGEAGVLVLERRGRAATVLGDVLVGDHPAEAGGADVGAADHPAADERSASAASCRVRSARSRWLKSDVDLFGREAGMVAVRNRQLAHLLERHADADVVAGIAVDVEVAVG